jgi:hypothetical protein
VSSTTTTSTTTTIPPPDDPIPGIPGNDTSVLPKAEDDRELCELLTAVGDTISRIVHREISGLEQHRIAIDLLTRNLDYLDGIVPPELTEGGRIAFGVRLREVLAPVAEAEDIYLLGLALDEATVALAELQPRFAEDPAVAWLVDRCTLLTPP